MVAIFCDCICITQLYSITLQVIELGDWYKCSLQDLFLKVL